MKLTEKFMHIMKIKEHDPDVEYEEYDDIMDEDMEEEYFEDAEDEEEAEVEAELPKPAVSKNPIFSFKRAKKEVVVEDEYVQEASAHVLPFSTNAGEGDIVKVIKPRDFSEAQVVAGNLKAGKTIVVNLEGIEISQAQRIIDFIGGASFAIDGTLKAISNNIFIVAPGTVDVSGDLRDEIINDDMISPELSNY